MTFQKVKNPRCHFHREKSRYTPKSKGKPQTPGISTVPQTMNNIFHSIHVSRTSFTIHHISLVPKERRRQGFMQQLLNKKSTFFRSLKLPNPCPRIPCRGSLNQILKPLIGTSSSIDSSFAFQAQEASQSPHNVKEC